MRRYYYAGGQRIAMRLGTTTLRFLLGDHLGSTAITATTTGSKLAELRYYPWGGVRYTYGTTPTDYRFTGQQDVSSIGLYFYNSRFYDAYLNRWISPDSIVPVAAQGTQAFDRYAYANNNPVRYTDPTGHLLCSEVPWEEDCDPNADAQIISLARRGGLTDDGEHMLQLYLMYRNTSGWWNEDGDFTLDEFLGLTLYYEYADTPSDGSGYFTEAVGRKLSWWCNYTGCTNDTASTLNYIGTRAVMRSRYAENEYNGISLEDLTQPNYGIVSFYDAIGMAQTAASNPAWESGAVGYNDPWDWGNLSMFPEDARDPMREINEFNLTSSSIVYRYGVDPYTAFVIVTFNQETYWKSYTAR